MTLDPQAQVLLDQMGAGGPSLYTPSPAQARADARAFPLAPGPAVAKVEDRLVPGFDGEITARIYTPEGTGPFPLLVWFHGGGWVVGDLDLADAQARDLTAQASCVVASVDYRLAPDTKFPGPVEDCYAATLWAQRNASSLNADPNRVAVGGDSAGGNLAAVVCLMARDRGGPSLVFQLLVYPVTDFDFTTLSYQQNGEGYMLTTESMEWFWNHYLRDRSDATNPYAAPLRAKDLSGLPPALVVTAEYDPLRDEGQAYAERLQAAGIPTEYVCYEGMVHGFFAMPAALDKGKQGISHAAAALRAAFST